MIDWQMTFSVSTDKIVYLRDPNEHTTRHHQMHRQLNDKSAKVSQ